MTETMSSILRRTPLHVLQQPELHPGPLQVVPWQAILK